MRPERRAEPGVEDVGVLLEARARPESFPRPSSRSVVLGADQPAAGFAPPPGHVGAATEGLSQVGSSDAPE